jgi:hypothetical protein
VWRFLRVPGKGKGYPIVVAHPTDGDLPLTVASAPEIVRAAMRDRVSVVIDLFDMKLSKADWRRIVKDCVRTLLYENKPHGLRHIFLEEAPEFVPQSIIDGDVYAEIEKLGRMGGNAGLGYTLIGQRAQELNKAVLELCTNLFLHRQQGKNAIQSLRKWFDVAEVENQEEIAASFTRLPQGECWAWIGGDNPRPPLLVKVPAKNSFHPDRRALHGKHVAGAEPINVGKFVASMKTTLVMVEEEQKAKDPKHLQAEIARLTKAYADLSKAKGAKAPDPEALAKAEERGFERGKKEVVAAADRQIREARVATLSALGERVGPLMSYLSEELKAVRADKAKIGKEVTFTPTVTQAPGPVPRPAPTVPPQKPSRANPAARNGGNGTLTGPQATFLRSLAWWKAMGHDRPSRVQVASIAGWRVTSGHLKNVAGSLRTLGLIDYPGDGAIAMTPQGELMAPAPDTSSTLEDSVRSILTGPQRIVFDNLPSDGEAVTRDEIAARCGWEPTSGHVKNVLGSMRSLEIIDYPAQGSVARANGCRGEHHELRSRPPRETRRHPRIGSISDRSRRSQGFSRRPSRSVPHLRLPRRNAAQPESGHRAARPQLHVGHR